MVSSENEEKKERKENKFHTIAPNYGMLGFLRDFFGMDRMVYMILCHCMEKHDLKVIVMIANVLWKA